MYLVKNFVRGMIQNLEEKIADLENSYYLNTTDPEKLKINYIRQGKVQAYSDIVDTLKRCLATL